jgi:hypothetical protein
MGLTFSLMNYSSDQAIQSSAEPGAVKKQQQIPRPPTNPSIVDVKRPQRPAFLNTGRLHYEIAVPEDKQRVLDFMMDYFLPYEPFQPGVQATRDEVVEYYEDIIKPCLTSGCSLLGFDGDELLAILLNKVETSPTDVPQLTVEDLNKEYPLKKNYARDIASGPYPNKKANQMHVFVEALMQGWTRLFPPGSKLLHIDVANVAPQAKRQGISKEMSYFGVRIAAELGCIGGIVMPIAAELREMMAKGNVPATLMREINFKDFKANGKPVWGKYQGSGTVYFATLDQLMKK